jgi:hypothetical protein
MTENTLVKTSKDITTFKKNAYQTDVVSTVVSNLGDDIISLTFHRFFVDNETGKRDEDFGLDTFDILFVSNEHARAFAKAILKNTK